MMRLLALSSLLLLGCSSPTPTSPSGKAQPAPAVQATAPAPAAAAASSPAPRPLPASGSPEVRCLPVVAKECGCVYACGRGVRDGDHWKVTHSFWKGTVLRAVIQRWCVHGQCTEVFAAEILCAQICAPRPADPSCHLDGGGACVSGSPVNR